MIAVLFAALALGTAPASAPPPAAAPAAPAPSQEAMALARRAAARDDFLVMIQSVSGGQIAEVEKGMGDLSPAEKIKVDEIGKRKMAEGIDRVVDKLAAVYAKEFSLEDLRTIDAFLQTPAGKAYSERLLPTLTVVGEGMKGFDFKREVRAEACTEVKKGCEDAAPMKMPPPAKDKMPAPPKP
jgi:hypothetical protein